MKKTITKQPATKSLIDIFDMKNKIDWESYSWFVQRERKSEGKEKSQTIFIWNENDIKLMFSLLHFAS
jgi:hypothetical protein